MTTVTFKVPFAYHLEYLPLRRSKSRRIVVGDTVDLEVRDLGPRRGQLRIKAHDANHRHDRVGFEGVLYGPAGIVSNRDSDNGFRPGELGIRPGVLMANPYQTCKAIFPAGAPKSLEYNYRNDPDERPIEVGRVLHDGREEAIAALRSGAEDLALIGGYLFRKASAPVYSLIKFSSVNMRLSLGDPSVPNMIGYRLGLDRKEELGRLLSKAEARWGTEVVREGLRVDALDWDLADTVEAGPNARMAALSVMSSLGKDITKVPHETITMAAELARIVQEGSPYGVDPNAVHSVLVGLRDALPPKAVPAVMKDIADGLDFIEASRDFQAHPLSEDDMEALEGLRP